MSKKRKLDSGDGVDPVSVDDCYSVDQIMQLFGFASTNSVHNFLRNNELECPVRLIVGRRKYYLKSDVRWVMGKRKARRVL